MTYKLLRVLTYREPLRALICRRLIARFRIGPYPLRLRLGAVDRPWYGWCVYYAALEAKALGYSAISVVEMGVASGDGLLCLCDHAEEVRGATGVEVVVYGIDTGQGLPPTDDWRDMLYCWQPGSYRMDRSKLDARLRGRAQLIIGDVRETLADFHLPESAPLGAVMFDLDLYTSTVSALQILNRPNRLPRVWCYFDDITGPPGYTYCEKTGERAAINEYNSGGGCLSLPYCFKGLPLELWQSQVYVDHSFDQPAYNRWLSGVNAERPVS